MTCLQSSIIFLFGSQPIWMKLCSLSKTVGSIFMHRVSSLWPSYIGLRRTAFPKAYGMNREVILGTLWGTCQNLGTLCCDQAPPSRKKKQSLHRKSIVHCPTAKWTVNSTLSTPNTTGKKKTAPLPSSPKRKTLHSMTQLPIGCMEILFLKLIVIIFGLN